MIVTDDEAGVISYLANTSNGGPLTDLSNITFLNAESRAICPSSRCPNMN